MRGDTCTVCHHNYKSHYHNEILWEVQTDVVVIVDPALKQQFEKADSMEEQSMMLSKKLQVDKKRSQRERKRLSKLLLSTIEEFQELGMSRSYAKLIENQLLVIKSRLKGTMGSETQHLMDTKEQLEKKLKLVVEAVNTRKPSGALTPNTSKQYSVVLLGEVGSGKTSFMNLFCNCLKIQNPDSPDHKFKQDDFAKFQRFNDPKLEIEGRLVPSKTSRSKCYNLKGGEFELAIIDTPGFDPSNKRNSMDVTEVIKKLFFIRCICLVLNYQSIQQSPTLVLHHNLTKIASILPTDIMNNVVVVFTHTSGANDITKESATIQKYFGMKIQFFCLENPYDEFMEASKKQPYQEVAETFALQLEKAGEAVAGICTAIRDFNLVNTYYFTILDESEEIDTAMHTLLNHKKILPEMEKIKVKCETRTTTAYCNTVCLKEGCLKNCHQECKEPSVRDCTFIEDGKCKICGHQDDCHAHEMFLFNEADAIDQLLKPARHLLKIDHLATYGDLLREHRLVKLDVQLGCEELLWIVEETHKLSIGKPYSSITEAEPGNKMQEQQQKLMQDVLKLPWSASPDFQKKWAEMLLELDPKEPMEAAGEGRRKEIQSAFKNISCNFHPDSDYFKRLQHARDILLKKYTFYTCTQV